MNGPPSDGGGEDEDPRLQGELAVGANRIGRYVAGEGSAL